MPKSLSAVLLLVCVPLLLAASGKRDPFPRCYDPGAEKVPHIRQLLECQALARRGYVSAYEKSRQRMPNDAHMDRFDAFQRKEVREFTAAHPDQATITGEEEKPRPRKERTKTLWEKVKDLCRSAKAELDSYVKKARGQGKRTEAYHPEAKKSLDHIKKSLKESGVDILKLQKDTMKDPGGTLKKAVEKYNKELDDNLASEMKRYFRGPADKKKR